jgi:hypothetical protein
MIKIGVFVKKLKAGGNHGDTEARRKASGNDDFYAFIIFGNPS